MNMRPWRSATITAVGALLVWHLGACASRHCSPGEVPNDTLKACVIPKECMPGNVLNERNECVRANASEADPDAGSSRFDAAATSSAADSGAGEPTSSPSEGSNPGTTPDASQPGAGGSTPGSASGQAPEAKPPTTGATCGNGVREGDELCDGSDCPSRCESTNPCVVVTLEGSASKCNARCSQASEITVCKSGDGCCARGCNYSSDADCSRSCGDGVVDERETCEPMSGSKPCPASCDDGDPCTQDLRSGTAEQCNVSCSHTPVVQAKNGDECCPASANANTDNDCKPKCGNGVHESGELCDGSDCPSLAACDDRVPCTKDTLAGSLTACNLRCEHMQIATAAAGDGCCPDGANARTDADCSPSCGNGVKEGKELCDGADCPTISSCNDGDPCTSDELTGSAGSCTADCRHVPITRAAGGDACCPPGANANSDSDCRPSCGNAVKESGEICDGNCRSSCSDNDPCTADSMSGTPNECNVECSNTPITAAINSDGCCPAGANANSDNDCRAVCGNGQKEREEECDPKATGEVVGYSCDTSCRRLNRLTPCIDELPGQCPGAPASICDSGFCRPVCPNLQPNELCEPIPGATRNESFCGGAEPRVCTWLCNNDDEDAYCGPSLWCDGTFCRVKPL